MKEIYIEKKQKGFLIKNNLFTVSFKNIFVIVSYQIWKDKVNKILKL